ncbi:Inositol 2-dehydrogenase/D-chiro-inositol 3-dehydrogenase [subsurface metagenome]|jgi:predicted dehydrogenase|uniref:Gfo/Idh/MocA-like oxidoreductase N-terminal domain-containing protein n=4 Tax=marine sediment metagenome TaxID=412755 RepID=X1ADB0_9ZZZZ
MVKKIKVGISGGGFVGNAHVEALRRIGVEVVGIAEATSELAKQKADALGLQKGYQSFEDMITDSQIQSVHIASPNFLHYRQVKMALLAQKHVICEKPLTLKSSESLELLKLAVEKNLVNAVNHNMRFYPMTQQARAMVQSGKIGNVYIIQGSYLQDWLLLETDWNWRLEPELGGDMRAVADIGSHWLDLITFITGKKVVEVLADFKTFLPIRKKPLKEVETFAGKLKSSMEYEEKEIKTEDYASILLHFEGGAHGALTVSQVSAGRKNRLFFEISGSKSSLAWDSQCPNELWVGQRSTANQVILKDPSLVIDEVRNCISFPGGHNEGYPDTFKQLYREVYNYIARGNFSALRNFPTFEDGYRALKMVEAVGKSAREGSWVKIE